MAKKTDKKASNTSSSKTAKPSKPIAKSLLKAVQKVLGKGTPTKPAAKSVALPVKESKKEAKKGRKGKKESKKQDELDLGDDLVGDDEMGAEEIPDLAEFEEVEVEETEELEIEGAELTAEAAKPAGDEEVFLTDAEGRRYCRVRECDQVAAVEGYCRFHYLQLWKRIQVRRKILTDGKLQRYVEELTSRYPDKFLEMIRKDLRNEKDFLAAIAELEIDESAIDNEFEDEAQNYIDEVRGITEGASVSEDQDEF